MSMAEAVTRMKDSTSTVPEAVSKVEALVKAIGSDLSEYAAATQASVAKFEYALERVTKKQAQLQTVAKEQNTKLLSQTKELSAALAELLGGVIRYEQEITKEMASTSKEIGQANLALNSIQQTLSRVEQEQVQETEPALASFRSSTERLQATLKRCGAELGGLQQDLLGSGKNLEMQSVACGELVKRSKARLSSSQEKLRAAGDKEVWKTSESLQSQSKLAEARLSAAVKSSHSKMQDEVRTPISTALGELVASLQRTVLAFNEIEAPCSQFSTAADKHSKSHQQGPDLRKLLIASKQLLARVNKLSLLANLV